MTSAEYRERDKTFADKQYRVTHLVAILGWVDLDLGCSTILLGH